MTAIAARGPSAGPLTTRQVAGLLAVAVIVVFWVMATRDEFRLGAYVLIGVAMGVIIQRSRLCFAGAFRDLVMSGDGRMMRAIIAGMLVATVGFAMLEARFVPDPSFGLNPQGAHIQPVAFATVAGGLIFGTGMVLAGGCVSGTLWRMGEGYVHAWVAMAGIAFGLWSASKTWGWWYDNDIARRSATWIPAEIGMAAGVAVVVGALVLVYLAVLAWEMRSPRLPAPRATPEDPAFTVAEWVRGAWGRFFAPNGWSYLTGGIALGILGTVAYAIQSPLGVTGGLADWTDRLARVFDAGGLPLRGLDGLSGCASSGTESWLTIRTTTMTGVVLGAFTASTFSGEFRLRYPRTPTRYIQVLIGGGLMGYASVIAIGCTIGAFFSSIPSLAVSGWIFGAALFGGAFIGVQVIKRLP